jgi:hypothetical protein
MLKGDNRKTCNKNCDKALFKGPNRLGVFPPHLRTEINQVSEKLCFIVFRMPDDGQTETPVILSVIHPLESKMSLFHEFAPIHYASGTIN